MLTCLKIWIPLNLLLFSIVIAKAQEQKPVNIPLTQQEQKIMLEMCEAAKFGFRAQFEAICPALKNKFEEAMKPKEKPEAEK